MGIDRKREYMILSDWNSGLRIYNKAKKALYTLLTSNTYCANFYIEVNIAFAKYHRKEGGCLFGEMI